VAVLAPDIREAVAATDLGDTLLEHESLAGRVIVGGRRPAEHPAQVGEVGLAGLSLVERGATPLGRELAGCHGGRVAGGSAAGCHGPQAGQTRSCGLSLVVTHERVDRVDQ